MKKFPFCNKRKNYFTRLNLDRLYNLYNERASFNLSSYLRQTTDKISYDNLIQKIKIENLDLYNQLRTEAERHNDIQGDLITKILFITGKQFYSSLPWLQIEHKTGIMETIRMINNREICNPYVRPRNWNPQNLNNNGVLNTNNSHIVGNLRTCINHLINEGILEIRWSQFVNNDFVDAEIINISQERLNKYRLEIESSLAIRSDEEKTESEFGFERLIRDTIRTDLSGITINTCLMPEFISFNVYKHHQFETDALGESPNERWIIEVSTSHKSATEILRKFYVRKKHFNDTLGVKNTIGLFISSSCGILPQIQDLIISLTTSEFIQILRDNNIKDTISCFGFN